MHLLIRTNIVLESFSLLCQTFTETIMAKDHWQNYPMFINNHDSIAFDHKAYSSRLQQLSDDVFQEHDSIVSVIDNYGNFVAVCCTKPRLIP